VEVDGFAVEVFKEWIAVEALGNLVGGIGVVAHDEQQGFLAAGFPFGAASFPAIVAQKQVLFPTVGSVVIGLFDQFAAGLPNQGCFDDARIDGFAQGRIANDVFEKESFVVFGGGGEVELGDEFTAAAGY
jgi:hypothetical protein